MNKKLAIAFALGLLLGMLFLSGDDDAPDTEKQAAKTPASHNLKPGRAPAPPNFRGRSTQPEATPWEQGYGAQYGMTPGGGGGASQWGRTDPAHQWEQPQPYTPAAPGFRGYDAPTTYGYPAAPATREQPWGAPGYRFRPSNGQTASRNRYSGEYPTPGQPTYAPESDNRQRQPSYQQPQSDQWGTPGYDERLPYSDSPPTNLYSVR